MANAATATYAGRSLIWAFVKAAGSPTEPKNIGWGSGATTQSANPDVALFGPQTEARVAGTSSLVTTSFLADTYQVTGTLTATNAKTITEAGLFDTTTAASTSTIASASQSSGATTITLAATIGPASGNFYIQVENEVELVTGGQGTATLTVVRGQISSTAAAHAIGATATSGADGLAGTNASLGGQTATYANTTAKGGTMFAHADFAGISLNNNDSVLFTWRDTFTVWLVGILSSSVLLSIAGGTLHGLGV
jgi:hypothetical protein